MKLIGVLLFLSVTGCATIYDKGGLLYLGEPPEITPYVGMSEKLLLAKGCFHPKDDPNGGIRLNRTNQYGNSVTKSYWCRQAYGEKNMNITVTDGNVVSISF